MIKKLIPALALTLIAASASAAKPERTTIVDAAMANPAFSTLVEAVIKADLVAALDGNGQLTVFAPTNDAFDAALADLDLTADELLADTELLTSVLTYHVVEGEFFAADVVELDGQEVETVNGESVTNY